MHPHGCRFSVWRLAAAALVGLTAALVVGAAQAVTIIDAHGRNVAVKDASRIVSIGGAVTEILYALGLADQIVAVDSTSLYPQGARKKPNVGYMRQLSAEGVLGLNPSLVLASEASGPKETMAVLEAASVPLVLVPERYTGEGVVEKVTLVARAAGAEDGGACLAATIRRQLAELAALRAQIAQPQRVLFILSFMGNRAMVAGRNTAADGIIKLAGGVNAIDDYDGYKLINDEAIVAVKPDVVLAMKREGAVLDADTVFAHPAFKLTPAAANRRFVSMEGLYLLGFGPRTAQAARDLAARLYPDAGIAPPASESAARTETCS